MYSIYKQNAILQVFNYKNPTIHIYTNYLIYLKLT